MVNRNADKLQLIARSAIFHLLVCNCYVWQALVMLHLWVEKNRENATGNVLERALKCIRREDIIHKCIRTVEEVTDVSEKEAAKAQLISLGEKSCMMQ
jgi:Death domain